VSAEPHAAGKVSRKPYGDEISDLMRGKINLFGLDALVNMAAAAGLHVEMRVHETA
jgi:predicted XRE-type DNA-binding protein